MDFYPRMRKDRDNIARKFRLCKKNGQVHESASRLVNAAGSWSETKQRIAKSHSRLGKFVAKILPFFAIRSFSSNTRLGELLAQFAA